MDLQGNEMHFGIGSVSNYKIISSFVEKKYAEKVKLQDPICKTIRYLNKGTTCRKSEIFTDLTHCNGLSKSLAAPFIAISL